MREKIGIRTLPHICTHQWTSEVPGVRVEDKSGSEDAGSRLDDLSLPQLQMSEAKEQRPMRTGRYTLHPFGVFIPFPRLPHMPPDP